MKIIVVSDTHNNLPNFKKATVWAEKQNVELLIHCGDVTSVQVFERAIADFSGNFLLSLGNADKGFNWENAATREKFKNKIFSDFGEISANKGKIAFTHFPNRARELAKTKNYEIVFYGHTHKPAIGELYGAKMINPGTLGGIYFPPTFCFFSPEDKILELKLLKDLEV